ncbi:MAG: HepT-like ribonuclease domain-containing protein [Flavobacteriaceae bacterium]
MSEDTEFEVLQRLVPELEAEGYDVYVHPNRPLIPDFFGNFSPDALALRPGKNLAIEVRKQSRDASRKLKHIAALFKDQPDWELRIVWIVPSNNSESLQIQNSETVRRRITEIRELASTGHTEPAVLLAWATFEALARAISTQQFARPQTPGRIVQILASEGYITPTEADLLRVLVEKRNRLIHGDLNVEASDQELTNFSAILETMLQQIDSQAVS